MSVPPGKKQRRSGLVTHRRKVKFLRLLLNVGVYCAFPDNSASRLTRLCFAFAIGSPLGFDFFRRLQLRSIERAKNNGWSTSAGPTSPVDSKSPMVM
jgi:hypothetical protein